MTRWISLGFLSLFLIPCISLATSKPTKLTITISAQHRLHVKRLLLSHPTRLVLDLSPAQTIRLSPEQVDPSWGKLRQGNPSSQVRRIVYQPLASVHWSLQQHPQQITLRLTHKQSTGQQTQAVTPPKQLIHIMIDPGHGGKDPGAIGSHHIQEKTIVLAIAKKLAHQLNRVAGIEARLTRNNDQFIPLRQRLALAKHHQADIFIALHADAYINREANGSSVYALSKRGATSEAARWLAQRDNQSELIGSNALDESDPSVNAFLVSLSQSATIKSSLALGDLVLNELSAVTRLHHKSVEQAAFVVLKSLNIPSLLIETGFVSNPKEAQRLMRADYQRALAAAIAHAIIGYLIRFPPQHSQFAAQQRHTPQLTQIYRVKTGDTLAKLAKHFSLPVASIKAINNLSADALHRGQTLIIPN